MLFLALRMGRPLFLEGEAGVGKTEIAKVLSQTLGRRLIRLQCYEGLDVSAAVYEWNYAEQMIAIRLAEAEGNVDTDRLSHDVFSERFLIKRPLLQALEPDPAGAPVLLIDELDRTDEAFEAFLLEVLADNQVTIPEMGTVKAEHPPIVVITSNRTREIHDALKRRCLYHWVGYPTAERELKIVRAKVPGISKKLSQEVVHFVQALRGQDLFKSPGVAESLDWAAALTELDVVALDPATVSDTLGVLLEVSGRYRAHRRHEREGIARRGACRDEGGGVSVARRRPARRPPRPEHRLFRARAARGRHAGRARRGARCARGGAAAGVGTREDFYWTLHAVFVKRHEHSVLFDQAFRMFFRKRAYLDKLLAMLSPQAPAAAPEPPQAGAQRVQEALFSGMNDKQAAGGARDRARCAPHGVRPRGAAEEGLRADERGRDRAGQGRDQAAGAVARRGEDAAASPPPARPHHRHAPHVARQHEGGRRADRPEISRAADQASRRSSRCSISPAR